MIINIIVALSIVTFLLSSCNNNPKGLYEFVSSGGSVKSINLIDDSTAITQESGTGLSLTVKYIIKDNFIIFKNVPYLGEVPFEITKDGLKNAAGEVFVKKSSSSVPSISSRNSTNKKSENVSSNGTNNISDVQLTPTELEAQKKFIQILDKNNFIKSNGLGSIISLASVSADKYILNVMTSNGQEVVEVVSVRGNYQVIPSKNLIANVSEHSGAFLKDTS
jgi:hypothetical protein